MKIVSVISLSLLVSPTRAFVVPQAQTAAPTTLFASLPEAETREEETNPWSQQTSKVTAATTFFWSVAPLLSQAAGPDWGIFEGRTGSLLHPIAMVSMALFSISTALLGFDWRRQRTMGDEISALKKSLPALGEYKTVQEAYEKTEDPAFRNQLQNALSTEQEIEALQKERKELAQKGPRDKHFAQGALLAFVGTAFAIEGPLNTYARAGKLFPGPHLYAGAGLVVLWALAAACVPSMQKGSDTARTIHIGANLAGLGLFGWQIVSGVPILLKVVELTKWP